MHAHFVLAHPEPHSFNAHLVRSGAAAVQAAGWTTSVSDLYAMAFDPCERPEHYTDRVAAERFDGLSEHLLPMSPVYTRPRTPHLKLTGFGAQGPKKAYFELRTGRIRLQRGVTGDALPGREILRQRFGRGANAVDRIAAEWQAQRGPIGGEGPFDGGRGLARIARLSVVHTVPEGGVLPTTSW